MQHVVCAKCKKAIELIDVFPKGLCLACHEKAFNARLATEGPEKVYGSGKQVLAAFSKALNKGTPNALEYNQDND